MATAMRTAESAVEVTLPPDQAHKKWLEWTGEGGPGMPQGSSEQVQAGQVDAQRDKAEKGNCYFEAGDRGTKVRMQLRFNPDVIQKEGLDADWVERRVSMYLNRFKNFAEGKPA